MKKQIAQVTEFQNAFSQLVNTEPSFIDRDLVDLRYDLMTEENEEYYQAVVDNNLVEIADALGDQLYVLLGTILSHGMQYIIEDVLTEIHRSNMSKLDVDGKPIVNGANGILDKTRPVGKVLKSYNYSEPNLKQFITK
jgi:predicted HAD superfamily Cof-like phosphohydrolase